MAWWEMDLSEKEKQKRRDYMAKLYTISEEIRNKSSHFSTSDRERLCYSELPELVYFLSDKIIKLLDLIEDEEFRRLEDDE